MEIILLKESIIVGIYTTIIAVFLFYFIQIVNKSSKLLLSIWFFFLLGFLKHFLGYFLNLQTEYCNQGHQCKIIHQNQYLNLNLDLKAIPPSILENIGEGIVFVLMGLLFTNLFKIKNPFLIAFLIGFSLHIVSDIVGLHTYFCKYYCV